MQRLLDALVGVVEANQRDVFIGGITQLALLIAAFEGLVRLSGIWWWLCLVLALMFLLNSTFLAFALKWQFQLKLEPPWRAIGLQLNEHTWHRLELHLLDGGVQVLRVPPKRLTEVLSAASEAGLEVITDAHGLNALSTQSIRLKRLFDIEALLPHVPAPELRGEIASVIKRVRTLEPTGCGEVLRELEIQLMAEKQAQTTTSLRGPKPVYEKELRAQISTLATMMDEALVVDRETSTESR